MTEGEARERAELLTDIGYDVFLDLAATPASSRTRVRFRCRRPGADTFAQLDLAATSDVRLNGQPLPPPDGGRLRLSGLAAENVLVADGTIADVGGMDPGLIRFTDPADGAAYVLADGFPDQAARLFCCFDQPSLPCEVTLTVRVPPGWHPLGNGRAPDGGDGVWRFGTVTGMRPNLFTVCAGPYQQVWAGGGPGVSVRAWRRAALSQWDEALATYLSVEFTGGWAGFGYWEKARAYRADELPGRLPVSSPMASSAQALSRFSALTYNKGAAVIRQLGALIGEDALHAGMRDYLARFGGDCGTSEDARTGERRRPRLRADHVR